LSRARHAAEVKVRTSTCSWRPTSSWRHYDVTRSTPVNRWM